MISLPGFPNFRDLGGLALVSGGTTAAGRVLRSAAATSLSSEQLLAAQVGKVRFIDLRSVTETVATPHALRNLSQYLNLPIIDPAREHEFNPGNSSLGEIYAKSLVRNAKTISTILAEIAAVEGPVLVSCAAGKDRTGMICALLLDAAGVEPAAIRADYQAGENGAKGEDIEYMLTSIHREFGSITGYFEFLGLSSDEVASLSSRLA